MLQRQQRLQAVFDHSLDAIFLAIIGENGAGKSTLMNILAGELQPDSGRIIYQGQVRRIPNPYKSQQMGISVVHQELALCPNLSIAENVSLNRTSTSFPLSFLKRGQFLKTARDALARLGLENVNLNQPVGQLSVAQQQLVEIGKALSIEARVLILDEPNSALTQEETTHLYRPAIRKRSQNYVGQLDIRIASLAQQMATLSGGNQQKVILARGLATRPAIFMLHEPTRGIDVGAKAEIYTILQELAAQGVAILIVSSELPELIGQCDRILVMFSGTITGHFERSQASEEPILACAMGQATHLPV